MARMQGSAHSKAIVSRASLSPKVVDALVGLRHVEPKQPPAAPSPSNRPSLSSAPLLPPRQRRPIVARVKNRCASGFVSSPGTSGTTRVTASALEPCRRYNRPFSSVLRATARPCNSQRRLPTRFRPAAGSPSASCSTCPASSSGRR
nr:hypothetical protein [Rhizobium sp. BG6]